LSAKKPNALRFGVGTSTEYRSAIWGLWVKDKGNEVSLAARVLGGHIKLSMHWSGNWRLAWTKQSGILAPGSTDRVEERWTRPAEFLPGWTRGPAVIVPAVDIRQSFSRRAEKKVKPVVWSPAPRPGYSHRFVLLFGAAGVPHKAWQSVVSPGALLGSIKLLDGQTVLLTRYEAPLVEKESSFIEKHKGGTWIDYPDHRPELVEASLFTAGSDDAGHPYILDVPLGWENVRGPQEREGLRSL